MDPDEPQLSIDALQRMLLYGSDSTRRRLARRIVATGGDLAGQLAMLVETLRSDAPETLRARCAELLKLVVDELCAEPQPDR